MASTEKVRRLLNLLERLQSGRAHNASELADFLAVSRRTIFRDLKTLQDSGVPVLYDAQKQGHWVTQGTFLPPTDLTLAETLSLLIVSQEASGRDCGIPFQEAARDAALKLLSNLPSELRQQVGEVVETVGIRTEAQPALDQSRQHYERALQAIREGRKLRLLYGSLAERKEIRTLVSPYRVVFMRRTWYVIGRSSLHRAIRTFHLGRVIDSELTHDAYSIPPRFNLKRYLGNAWHMIRDRSQRNEVCVRFQPLVATNVAEVSWHPTQQLHWNDDGSLDFTVTVDGLSEILWWILGYGDQAEVRQPAILREQVCSHVERLARTYGLLTDSDHATRSSGKKSSNKKKTTKRSTKKRTTRQKKR
ncbi:MAG: transcriptional regulator [Planctomycetaceae bacterium]|nr:transcriptional regulator [Planctomycetaceae bacterium]